MEPLKGNARSAKGSLSRENDAASALPGEEVLG
jgi:hypothetical protein